MDTSSPRIPMCWRTLWGCDVGSVDPMFPSFSPHAFQILQSIAWCDCLSSGCCPCMVGGGQTIVVVIHRGWDFSESSLGILTSMCLLAGQEIVSVPIPGLFHFLDSAGVSRGLWLWAACRFHIPAR